MSEALSRTRRSLDLIPYILEHQGITLDELAEKFNISTEVLYEDLDLLFCCGLPGYTPLELIDLNFHDGYVSVANPQVLDIPRRLSKEELLRLHLGLELCSKFAPAKLQNRITNLKNQISSLLQQSAPIEIIQSADKEKLKLFVSAIGSGHAVSFLYASANSDTKQKRTIFPTNLTESMNHIYIEGDEDVTGLPKTFRLDRAENIEIIADLNMRVTPDLKKIDSEQVKLFVSKEAQSFLNINSAIISESHLLADGYEVLIDNVSEKWLISEVFGYGGEVRVLAPERIAKNISEIATKRLGEI
ncbi:MAG: hypothetical protein RL129_998 [Actinomycetota bacterium]